MTIKQNNRFGDKCPGIHNPLAQYLQDKHNVGEGYGKRKGDEQAKEQFALTMQTMQGETGEKAKVISEEKQAKVEKLKGLPLKEQLSELGVEYFDIETTQEQLNKVGKLIGKKLEFSKEEKEKSKGLLTESLSKQELSQVIDIIDRTGKENVCFTQLPATWDVDGKTEPYSKRKIREIMQQASEKDSNIQNMWQGSYVTEKTKDFISNGNLKLFTFACVEGSKSTKWDGDDNSQLAIIKELTGTREPSEENAGVWIAGMVNNVKTGKRILVPDYMRINTLDTDRDPLNLHSSVRGFGLDGSDRVAYSLSGVGVSLDFPKR